MANGPHVALALTILVFLLNPLLANIPKFLFAKWINRYRRDIGVAAFLYVCIHFLKISKVRFD